MFYNGKSEGKFSFTPIFAAIALLSVGLAGLSAGCGGGGGGGTKTSASPTPSGTATPTPSPSPTASPTPTPADVTSLDQAVTTGTPSANTIQTLATQFQTGYAANPTDPTQAAGYAITLAASDSETYSNQFGVAIPGLVSRAKNAAAARSAAESQGTRLASLGQYLVLWNLPSALQNGAAPAIKPTDLVPFTAIQAAAAQSASTTPVQVQTSLAALDADLVKVETALAVPISQPSYVLKLTDPNHVGGQIWFGNAEFRTLLASVEVVRAIVNVSLIYDADTSNWANANDLMTTDYATALNNPGTAVPYTSFIPTSPFLTLESDGTTRASNVLSELNNAANNAKNAITIVEGYNNSDYLLNPGAGVTVSELNQDSANITTYQTYLDGAVNTSVDINGSVQTVSVNVGHFFNNPPANLYSFLPKLTSATDPFDQSPSFYTGANAFSDPTFGGIFPNGYPGIEDAETDTYIDVVSGETVEQFVASAGTPHSLN